MESTSAKVYEYIRLTWIAKFSHTSRSYSVLVIVSFRNKSEVVKIETLHYYRQLVENNA